MGLDSMVHHLDTFYFRTEKGLEETLIDGFTMCYGQGFGIQSRLLLLHWRFGNHFDIIESVAEGVTRTHAPARIAGQTGGV